MQLNAGTLVFLGIAALSRLASAQPPIVFGQEFQDSDQTNHWVAWEDGYSACPGHQVLGVLTAYACDQPFTLAGGEFTFTGCSGDPSSGPTGVLDPSGTLVSGCNAAKDNYKTNCNDGLHDIIQYGKCGINVGL